MLQGEPMGAALPLAVIGGPGSGALGFAVLGRWRASLFEEKRTSEKAKDYA